MTGARGWAEEALELLFRRVEETAGQVGARFPLYADPDDGRWTTTGRGSWTGGFWAGLLWLRARHTGVAADRSAAAAVTARLAPWAEADTATRGLILWYGTAPAAEDDAAAGLRERAAKTALAAWDPELGLVPWGTALGGPRLRARADGVPGLVPLLASAGPEGRTAAATHLHRHLDLCLSGEAPGRPRPSWRWDEARGGWAAEPEPAPGWARGEAWLLLAVADGLLRAEGGTPWRTDRLTAATERLFQQGEFLDGPLVPPAESAESAEAADPGDHGGPRDPGGHLDTSAAAIAAVALLKLAQLSGAAWATACAARSEAVLHHLVEVHLTRSAGNRPAGAGPAGTRPAGMLLDGCYEAKSGTAVRHELVWGDFFLALGLAGLLGRVDLTRV
ncbi:sugar ABC transporter permease [Streptomyces sp. NPDC053513]|uniref:sugar ABC transporter permease n=1 Tax=unclassified Streptomyces TaxID=2593676 RepID=UPI0037D3322C